MGSGGAAGRMGEDEVDRLAHGEDLRRLLVRHLHAVGVLELLHQRVEVERVRFEVLLEARPLVDAGGIHVELVGEMRPDQGEDVLAGHGVLDTVAASADARGAALLSAPASSNAPWVRPTTSLRTPRAASWIACEKPTREKRPCGTTPSLRRPSR